MTDMVLQAQSGDIEAFERIFQHYTSGICTYLTRMVGNTEEARDLAQETFLKAWRTLPTIHDETRFGPWLYRIATNVAIDFLRVQKWRWLRWSLPERSTTPTGMTSTGQIERIAEVEHVAQALAQVKPQYRACLLLQIDAGFSQREIADLLHISEKSISVYVKRGCEQFRKAYNVLANKE